MTLHIMKDGYVLIHISSEPKMLNRKGDLQHLSEVILHFSCRVYKQRNTGLTGV